MVFFLVLRIGHLMHASCGAVHLCTRSLIEVSMVRPPHAACGVLPMKHNWGKQIHSNCFIILHLKKINQLPKQNTFNNFIKCYNLTRTNL